MPNLDPFLPFAFAEALSKKLEPMLTQDDCERLLLWKAHLKRMRPIPSEVLAGAVGTFRAVLILARANIGDVEVEQLTMDKLGDLLWDQLDDETRRAWLLKV